MWLLLKPGPGPWTRILKTLKNVINMALNNSSDFRELFFYNDHAQCDFLFKSSFMYGQLTFPSILIYSFFNSVKY